MGDVSRIATKDGNPKPREKVYFFQMVCDWGIDNDWRADDNGDRIQKAIVMTRRRKKNYGLSCDASDLITTIVILTGVYMRVVELADVLEVSGRTIYRILSTIRANGLPLNSKRYGSEVRYWMDRKKTSEWFSGRGLHPELVEKLGGMRKVKERAREKERMEQGSELNRCASRLAS